MAQSQKLFNNLVKSYEKYDADCKAMEKYLKDKIDFLFAVIYLDGDGLRVLSEDQALSVSLSLICNMIDDGEEITQQVFEDYGQ